MDHGTRMLYGPSRACNTLTSYQPRCSHSSVVLCVDRLDYTTVVLATRGAMREMQLHIDWRVALSSSPMTLMLGNSGIQQRRQRRQRQRQLVYTHCAIVAFKDRGRVLALPDSSQASQISAAEPGAAIMHTILQGHAVKQTPTYGVGLLLLCEIAQEWLRHIFIPNRPCQMCPSAGIHVFQGTLFCRGTW
jgi:hypothetical protein